MTWKLKLDPYIKERGLDLDPASWRLAERYLGLVFRHNKRVNLTGAESMDEMALRHLADGFAVVPTLKSKLAEKPSLLDVGSGAGFIGVGIKLAWPEADVHLLESSYRKYQFLNLASMEVGLPGLKVHWRRADIAKDIPGFGNGFDAVTERAVAPLPDALQLCLPLCKPGGLVVAYQSLSAADGKAERALDRLGAVLESDVAYRLPEDDRERHLLLFRKSQ